MAMIANAFVELFVERLAKLAEEEMVRLLGVDKDLVQLKDKLFDINAFLEDAESKKISEKFVSLWLAKLRDLIYDADDLFDDCRVEAEKNQDTSASEPQSSSSFRRRYCSCPSILTCIPSLPFRHKIGKRIQGLNTKLDEIYSEIPSLKLVKILSDSNTTSHKFEVGPSSRRQTTHVTIVSEIVGIDEDAKCLVDWLTQGVSTRSDFPVCVVTGMPGIGKTTLAKKVYNDSRIKVHFDVAMWISVSKNYDEVDLLKQIVSFITKENREKGEGTRENYGDASKDVLCSKIRELVKQKRFFLVLDDLWSVRNENGLYENVWENLLRSPLHAASIDSKVLITARNGRIAGDVRATRIHKVKKLSDVEGWYMLCKMVFRKEEEEEGMMEKYNEIGMDIVKKCGGFPLAISAVAGVLKMHRTDRNWERCWKEICSRKTWTDLTEDTVPGLFLSYDDLLPHLKQCFIYCSLFPEDFTFHKPNLVQMWIAEGFVKESKQPDQRSMEELGNEYYDELVSRNLLEEVPHYFDRSGCKMHDLFRSLALDVSQNKYIYKDPNLPRLTSTSMKPRHLYFIKEEDIIMVKEHETLRTLLVSRNPSIKILPAEFFGHLPRLRALDISYTGVRILPESLGNLIHLRFLNVSFTKIKSLPDSIQDLKNLTTLKANGSRNLRVLPKGATQLKKLRHLAVGGTGTQLDCMPPGLGNLKRLKTLKGFVANDGTSGERSNLKELRNLSHLTDLSVYKLENIASTTDLKEAYLGEKQRLRYLRLSCSVRIKDRQREREAMKRIEEVFEGIDPPKNLEAFHLEGFFGCLLPRFITDCSLRKLTWFRFQDCRFVQVLPPLGRLPELTVLQIWGATSILKIESEFFHGANGFPNLQELHLLALIKLESISMLEKGAMRLLNKLHIEKCPKLKSLPSGLNHVEKLTELVIEDCQNIEEIKNLSSVTVLKLENNSKLKIISNLPALNIMSIVNCPYLSDVVNTNSLSYVVLSNDNMEVLPQWLKNATVKKLDVQCNACLIRSICNRGADWIMIQNILSVEAKSRDGSNYISYRKENPFIFRSSLTDDVNTSSTNQLQSSSLQAMTINNTDDDE